MSPTEVLARTISLVFGLGVFAAFALMTRAAFRIATGRPVFPPQERGPDPRTGGDAMLAALVWLGLNFLIPGVYGFVRARERGTPLTPLEQMVLISVVNGSLLVILPVTLFDRTGGRFARALLNGRGVAVRVGQGLVACLTVAPVVFGVNLILMLLTRPLGHPLMKMVQEQPSPSVAVLAVVSGGILAPAAEELMFRGVLLPWLARPRRPRPAPEGEATIFVEEPADAGFAAEAVPDPENAFAAPRSSTPYALPGEPGPADPPPAPEVATGRREWKANVITSALFGLVHLTQWPAPIPIFMLSLALGRLYLRTGSLLAAMAMHAAFNSISTLALFLSVLTGDPKPPA